MPMVDALLPEFDHEMSTTRKLLERVPEDRFAWQPHVKSFSLGALAAHVATLPAWGEATLARSAFEVEGNQSPVSPASRAELIATFDKNVAIARAALTGKTDAELLAPWTLTRRGKTIFSMPKAAVLRSFVLSHLIHHRGQLSVYLRQLDVSVPSIYGPSADEPAF